jgi:hypothetical protein
MTLLELENTGEGMPQGVVLALIGDPGPVKDQESFRTLRMYNLASLTHLAKWVIAHNVYSPSLSLWVHPTHVLHCPQGANPLDLRRPSNWTAQQTVTKKHRPQNSITRSLKSLIDSPTHHYSNLTAESSYQTLLSPSTPQAPRNFAHGAHGKSSGSVEEHANGSSNLLTASAGLSPVRKTSAISADSTWDLMDDLPLRWATDYIPLASAGSRLANTSVISYDLWREGGRGRGTAMLAVATKANIVLYGAPKGERAFRLVKVGFAYLYKFH